MEQGGEMREYLNERNTRGTGRRNNNKTGKNKDSRLRAKASNAVAYLKKWGYSYFRLAVFTYFVYSIENTFARLRVHIAKNGGLKRQM